MIKDLEPGSLYFFRSRAWNKVGPSSWSDPAEFETDSMVPKKIPKVELVGQRADKLLATTDVDLAWNTSDPRGRPIRDYLLEKAMGYDKSDENPAAFKNILCMSVTWPTRQPERSEANAVGPMSVPNM